MPKRKILEGADPSERAKMRRELGTLKSLTVQPATRRRYDKASEQFFSFLKTEGLVTVSIANSKRPTRSSSL